MGGAPSIPTDPSRRIQVIGAGYSRTGTVSLQLALEKLLNGPVMHGGTQILRREDAYVKKLVQAYRARHERNHTRLRNLLDEVFTGFVGCTDIPPIDFIPELMELYPDAKVVLITRDPKRWAASIECVRKEVSKWWIPYLMWPIPGWRFFPTLLKEFEKTAIRIIGAYHEHSDPSLALLHNWNRSVQELVPKEKLLIFRLEEGWDPLCKFLNVDVPNEPFPNANDSAALERTAQEITTKVLVFWGMAVGATSAVSFILWNFWTAR